MAVRKARRGGGRTIRPYVVTGGGGTSLWSSSITHGDQLTIAHTGPWSIQNVAKGSETLSALDPGAERISTYPGNARPSWIPGTTYVYNNNLTNYGGIVPAGGLTIDGHFVPAGTWVVQFRNFSAGVIIEGDCGGAGAAFPGVLFRGCRMRGPWSAPGWFNQNGQSYGGVIWLIGCDAGAANTTNMCESIFESKGYSNRDTMRVIRCYLTYATTLVFMRNSGDAAIENWCDSVSDFGDTSKHLNGIANSGNQTCDLWARNHMVIDKGTGSVTGLTDVIQMAADDGPYPGTGTNYDGSTGYVIKDNLLGGAQYTLQLGVDKANTSADVKSVVVTGNKFSTTLFANSGSAGLGYKGPLWGSYGNTWSSNTWADGVNAGQTIPSSAVSPGGSTTITHGNQISAANTGHDAYFDSGLGRLVTDADLTVHNSTVSASDFVADGGTITKRWFKSGFIMDRNNVTLTACKWTGGISGYYAGTHHPFTINWCTAENPTSAGDDGIQYQDYTAYRCRIGDNSDGAKINGGVTMTECFIRTKSQNDLDHNDGLQAVGSYTGNSIIRCNIDCRPVNGGGGVNAAYFVADGSSGLQYLTDCWLAGGNSSIRCHENSTYNVQGNQVLSGSYTGSPTNFTNAGTITWGTVRPNVLVDASGNVLSTIPGP